ncbi:MAG: hypothetical protein M3Z75_26655 [Actinomycetota bacterium]|nr:hypothetical protein [Actinomycetota bacterium]
MSIKSKVFAAAAALTLVGGAGAVAATATAANAATPSCGSYCIDIFNHDFGTHAHPAFVQDTYRQGEKVGQPQILFRVANFDPAEDYTFSYQGLVSDFFAANLVSAAFNLHYGNGSASAGNDDAAFELQYSPYGVDSGLCSGLASTAVAGEKVTLQPCGVSSKTVWAVDSADFAGAGYVPFINGSDSNFSQPFVLTYPSSAYPTDNPRPSLYVSNLTGSQGANGFPTGTINSSQLFGWNLGVLAP